LRDVDARQLFFRRFKGKIIKLVVPEEAYPPTITFSYEEDGGLKTRWCFYDEKYYDTLKEAITSNKTVNILVVRYLIGSKEDPKTVIEEWVDDIWIES